MKRVLALLLLSMLAPLAAHAEYRHITLTVFGMD